MRENAETEVENGHAKRLYSVPEAAEQLSLSERKVWYLIKAGELETSRVGARRLVPAEALDAYVSRLVTAGTGPTHPHGPATPRPTPAPQPRPTKPTPPPSKPTRRAAASGGRRAATALTSG